MVKSSMLYDNGSCCCLNLFVLLQLINVNHTDTFFPLIYTTSTFFSLTENESITGKILFTLANEHFGDINGGSSTKAPQTTGAAIIFKNESMVLNHGYNDISSEAEIKNQNDILVTNADDLNIDEISAAPWLNIYVFNKMALA